MNRLVSNNDALSRKLYSVSKLRDRVLSENAEKQIVTLDSAHDLIVNRLRAPRSGRLVVGIGGFPASGKTTSAKRLVGTINDAARSVVAVHLPMDGFHLSSRLLAVNGLSGIKGDLSTYDVTAYVNALLEYRRSAGVPLRAPDYVRAEHEVVQDAIEIGVNVRLAVTEGIYVGYSEGAWGQLRDLLDVLLYLDVSPEECADRIVQRNAEVGRSDSAVEAKLSNDFAFMARSIRILANADYVIRADVSGYCA